MTTDTAVGYIRLSQDVKSLDRQRQDVEEYINKNGYPLDEIYNEGKRTSGFDADRPEYTALLDHIEGESIDVVIIPNLSRLSRDRKERLRLLLNLDAIGVQLHSVDLDDEPDWGHPLEPQYNSLPGRVPHSRSLMSQNDTDATLSAIFKEGHQAVR